MDVYLLIIRRDPWTTAPRPLTDVGLPIRKSPDEPLQLREILNGGNALHIPLVIQMHAILQSGLGRTVGPMPGTVQILHKGRVTLSRRVVAHLLDRHVAARADDVADVDEVVAHVAILCDFGLFAFKAVVEGDDGAGGFVGGREDGGGAGFDGDVVVVVPAVDFEGLVMV